MLSIYAYLWRLCRKKYSRLHFGLLGTTLALCLLGFAMLYSASGGHMQPWASPQIARFWVGFFLIFFIALINIRILLHLALPLFFLSVISLVIVILFGHMGMGAQRWVKLGFLTLQPSEPTKLTLILALAYYFHRIPPQYIGRILILIPPLLLIAVPVALILKQPNLGTASICALIGGMMFFVAGVRWWKFITVAVAAAAAAPTLWLFLHEYQKKRIFTFLNPESDPLGAGYNIIQSKIAIGSGGFFGKGFLQGSQGQLDFLPEKHTDFIFTMLTEEFGFLGGLGLLALYAMLLAQAYTIALSSQSHFGRMVAFGVAAYFFVHIFINIGMVMGLLPVVGVPLPFLSYGGTTLLTSLAAVGLLQCVHIHQEIAISRTDND